jgi:hypothetical protein
MLVKMLSTRKGSPNGTDVQTYFEGHPYEIHGDLLDVFLKEGWCEAVEPFRAGEGDGEQGSVSNTASASGQSDSGEETVASPAGPAGPAENPTGGGADGGDSTGGNSAGADSGEKELVLAEAEVLAKYTRD